MLRRSNHACVTQQYLTPPYSCSGCCKSCCRCQSSIASSTTFVTYFYFPVTSHLHSPASCDADSWSSDKTSTKASRQGWIDDTPRVQCGDDKEQSAAGRWLQSQWLPGHPILLLLLPITLVLRLHASPLNNRIFHFGSRPSPSAPSILVNTWEQMNLVRILL
jgi:hypothetical protein